MEYRRSKTEDVPQLLALWLTCFSEKEEAAELFFKRNLSYTRGYLAADKGNPIAALYLVDCTLCGKRAHYLCGAATLPQYRKRGVMSALIQYALTDAKQRGDSYSVLLPANDGLYDFYARLGYQPKCTACTVTVACDEAADGIPTGTPDFQRLQAECNQDKFLLWNNSFIQFAKDYYACYGVHSIQSENAFALYEQNGDFAEVFYAIYNDIKELKTLLSEKGVRRFSLTGGGENPLFQHAERVACGMIRPLGQDSVPDEIFIGITLS